MSDRGALLIPNIAAEEGAVWNATRGERTVQALVELWRALFSVEAELLGARVEASPAPWWSDPSAGAFAELDDRAAFAWLNTPEAARIAREHRLPLAGAAPEVVAQVHDKAFALEVARREGLAPREFDELPAVYSPRELADDPGAVLQDLETRLAAWPPRLAKRFTLKPRLGSSGRGRTGGSAETLDHAVLRGAFERLAARGGALLEPWVERRNDLSAQLWIGGDGTLRLLGTLALLVSPAGVYRGHRGTLDNKGRVTSGLEDDEALREAAAAVSAAARARGYRGPCGVDAFSYVGVDGGPAFRPVVEFNARFTVGTVVLGLLRRALPRIRRLLPADAGERRSFWFSLEPPPHGWPTIGQDSEADGRQRDLVFLALGPERDAGGPGVLIARNPERLDAALSPPATSAGPGNGQSPPEM